MYIMSIWGKIIGCENIALLFPMKWTFYIQSICKLPWFSKSNCLFKVYWKNVLICCTCSPLRKNNCFSSNFNVIYLFKNWEEAGWFVLQNVPLLCLEQESTIPAHWARTSTSPFSTRNQISIAGCELQASEWGFICIIADPHHSHITRRRDSLACFPGTVCSYITYA